MVRKIMFLAAFIIIAGVGAAVIFFSADSKSAEQDIPFEEELAEICEQCPDDYPQVVLALPEKGGFADKSDSELFSLLENWNPVIRDAVSKELARRGESCLPQLKKGMQSSKWKVRCGVANALAILIKEDQHNQGREKTQEKYADFTDDLIRLLEDDNRSVRAGALGALSSLGSGKKKIAMAVLALGGDKDEYLADAAMINLEKHIGIDSLDPDVAVKGFTRAMENPLPRGKGHILRMIKRMDEKTQRKCVPMLLDHLDWNAGRDTMFASGGQKDALEVLVNLREEKLIPKLPKLLDKKMRGLNMFDPSIDAIKTLGSNCKSILPELKAYMEKLEKEKKVETKLAKLKEAIEHVEK